MAFKGLIIDNTYWDTQDILDKIKEDPVYFGLAPKLIKLMLRGNLNRPDGFSVTEIFSIHPRNPLLSRLIDYYVPIEKSWYSAWGNLIHNGFEKVELYNTESEVRVFADFDGMEISGQPDEYHPDTRTVIDYKSSKSTALRKGHIKQLNGYAVLLRENGRKVESAYVAYTPERGKQRMAEVPLLDHEKVKANMAKRGHVLRDWYENRTIMDRKQGCHPACKYYCPFYEFCQSNPDKMEVPGLTIRAEGEIVHEGNWTLWEGELVSEIPQEDRYESSQEAPTKAEAETD